MLEHMQYLTAAAAVLLGRWSDSSGIVIATQKLASTFQTVLSEASIPVRYEQVNQGIKLPFKQVTYKRLKEAVQSLSSLSQQGPASGLVDVLFGQRPPRFMANLPPWTPINSGTLFKRSLLHLRHPTLSSLMTGLVHSSSLLCNSDAQAPVQ